MKKTLIISIITLLSGFAAEAQVLNLSLQQCREMALTSNEDVKISQYQNEKAKIEKKIAQTAYFPKFSGSATYGWTNTGMEVILPKINLPFSIMQGIPIDIGRIIPDKIDMGIKTDFYMFGVTLQQPVFAGGKVLTGNKMAKKTIELTEEYGNMLRMSVIAEAEKAYWQHYSLSDKIKLFEQYEVLLDTLYESISAMISVKMATENDLLKVLSRKGNIQYQMQRAKNGMELSRMQLCRIIGADLNTKIVLTDTIAAEVDEITDNSYNLTMRPEYRIMQKQLELKELNIRNVLGDFLPTLGIMAGYNYIGKIELERIALQMKRPNPIVMASLSVPIFHFLEGSKKIKSAKIVRDIQQEELNKNSKLLTIEMHYTERNLQDAFLLVRISETALEQAQANLRRTQDSYEVGMSTLLDVLDAQAQWQEAYSNSIDARVQYKISEVEYLRVTGKL